MFPGTIPWLLKFLSCKQFPEKYNSILCNVREFIGSCSVTYCTFSCLFFCFTVITDFYVTQLWLLTYRFSLIFPVFASLLCFALFQAAMPSPVSELRGLNVKHHEASFLEDYTFQQASPCIRALRDPVSNRVTLVGSFQLMWVYLCLEGKFRMRLHGKYHVTWNWP